jgi:hypothetical protein
MVHLCAWFQRYILHVQNECKALDAEGINIANYGKDMEPIKIVYDMTCDTVPLGG